MTDSDMKNTRVYRGGYTTRQRVLVQDPEVVVRSPSVVGTSEDVELRLELPVSQGYSSVHVVIGKDDFAPLLGAMAKSHRATALHAMASELAKWLAPNPPRG